MKVNLVAKIMQSAYLRFIFSLRAIMRGSCFHVMHKKLSFLAVLTCFLILGKIQDVGRDGDHCRFQILQHIKNFGEEFACTSEG